MNKKLIDSLVKLHEKEFGGKYIAPISRVDVEIISLLLKIIEKCGKSDILRVFEQYKIVADEDIRLKLDKIQANMETENQAEEFIRGIFGGRKTNVTIQFNDIETSCFMKSEIFSWMKTEDENGTPAILLNKGDIDATKHPLVYNTLLLYADEETRDEDFELIIKRKNGR